MTERPLILLSNDDGVYAEGIRALRRALSDWADVYVVAPEREQSASSHRITLSGPLRHVEVSPRIHSVDGTPADCVYVALNLAGLLPRRPDIVVSGINHGLNLAMDVVYSGTVAAAREGAVRGVRGVAISADHGAQMELVAAQASPIVRRALECEPLSGPPLLLNVNFPSASARGVLATCLGRRDYVDRVEVRTDPRGRSYYWIGGPASPHDGAEGTDTTAIDRGYASVSPLSLELTYTPHLGVAAFAAGPREDDP